MPFLMIWWKHIAIVFAIIALLGYIAVIKHQRNAARLELKEFKLAIDQERVKQQLKNAAIERESIAIQNVLVQRHADNIGKVRDYYDKRLIMYRDANAALDNRLRVECPKLSKPPANLPKAGETVTQPLLDEITKSSAKPAQ